MRLRSDSAHIAGWRRAYDHGVLDHMDTAGADPDWSWRAKDGQPETPAAEIGDVWPVTNAAGEVEGYCLTCPREGCGKGMHCWDHAYNCKRRADPAHLGCWSWTGSVEDGTLTATPSLQVMTEIDGKPTDGCGFHGWLKNGVLAE